MQNERQWHHYYTWQKTTIQGRWKNSEGAKQIFWYETGRHFKVLKDQDQFKEKNKKFAKRIKADAQTKSRYRNNQVQYDLNNSTVAQLDDLSKLRIKKALEMIKNLMEDIKSRNELRLVISQPGGWKTLTEYV